ncbi:DUF2442 domain-containing protein [Catalinimonas niigatensis]|uniref:DUF2442 domain-containing protein n=1 Tax=Catalinimonas niigatensis TaxID=1397264 RepID=UPI002665BF11|nr:DUF2442 domain-containing protein [Catalinimonas niigatensis]WPP51110.1 DUF2442 domain-containing protein [Catalinimonas niigatensis]
MKITEQYTEQPDQNSLSVTDAHYIGDFAIRVTFNDKYKKLVDFKPFLEQAKHPAIKKYLDENQFKNFRIKDGNLDWNDFDMCFPLEDIYKNAILKQEKTVYNAFH